MILMHNGKACAQEVCRVVELSLIDYWSGSMSR